jgi:hypothetical protein
MTKHSRAEVLEAHERYRAVRSHCRDFRNFPIRTR